MQVDIDILVYAVIAALLLGRLWAVLGTRNDDEPQRFNPFSAPTKPKNPPKASCSDDPSGCGGKSNVVSRLQPPPLPPLSLAGGLERVKTLVPAFDEKLFLREARDIFSSIVGAYASGNLTLVADMLSPELLGQFQEAVEARKAAGQTAQTHIARVKETETTSARVENNQAYLTIRFVSEQENLLRDAAGTIIGGTEGKHEEVTDIWTFVHAPLKPGTKWVVVETRG